MVRLSDLRERDVVSLNDGRRIGAVGDLELDPDTGQVLALIIPGPARMLGLLGSAEGDARIAWADIVTIGEDVILVKQAGPRVRG